jgi:hypothetical protein
VSDENGSEFPELPKHILEQLDENHLQKYEELKQKYKSWSQEPPRDELLELTSKLQRANLALDSDPENPRAAVIQALQAVVEFLHGDLVMEKLIIKPYLYRDPSECSRPLELLTEELTQLRNVPSGMILPPFNAGHGGVYRRRIINTLKGEAAFAVEQLVRTNMTRRAAAEKILAVLKRHGFDHHGVRRDDEEEGFLRTINRYKKRRKVGEVANDDEDDSDAAKRYRALCAENEAAEPWDEENVIWWLIWRLYSYGFVERIQRRVVDVGSGRRKQALGLPRRR